MSKMALRALSCRSGTGRLQGLAPATKSVLPKSTLVCSRKVNTTVCMADQSGSATKLDKSTPDSTWEKLLSAQEVRIVMVWFAR